MQIRDSIETRDIATAQTAGAVDLKIKQDLFAKDIAYDGQSKTHLSQQSDRDKNINLTLHNTTEGVMSAKDNNYRQTLENYNLVKAPVIGQLSGELSPKTDNTKKDLTATRYQIQKSSSNRIA